MKEFYHIGFPHSPGADYAILTGDPGRVSSVAAYLQRPRPFAHNREYVTWLGYLESRPVLVCSTGIGGPSAAIAVEELYMAGVRTFLRVGTCGGMQPSVRPGDLVAASGAIRMEGLTREYLPLEYPAVADPSVLWALDTAVRGLGHPCHVGVVQSKDSFYGQHSPERMPVSAELEGKWRSWVRGGALASEMECAAIFIVSAVLRARSGAVLSVVWNQERARLGLDLDLPPAGDMGPAVQTAVEAMRLLIRQDQAKANAQT